MEPNILIIMNNYLKELETDNLKIQYGYKIDIEKYYSYFDNISNWLINYLKDRTADIPVNKMILFIRLLGKENVSEKTLFLIHGLIIKSNIIINSYFDNPILELTNLFKIINIRINYLNEIFMLNQKKYIKQ